jgi:hypothetical protein
MRGVIGSKLYRLVRTSQTWFRNFRFENWRWQSSLCGYASGAIEHLGKSMATIPIPRHTRKATGVF